MWSERRGAQAHRRRCAALVSPLTDRQRRTGPHGRHTGDPPCRHEPVSLSPASHPFFPLSSLFPFFFSLSQLSLDWAGLALNFQPTPQISYPPLRFPARPSISRLHPLIPCSTHVWWPPHPPGRLDDTFGRSGRRLAPEADAIGILARRGGCLPPRARLDT